MVIGNFQIIIHLKMQEIMLWGLMLLRIENRICENLYKKLLFYFES